MENKKFKNYETIGVFFTYMMGIFLRYCFIMFEGQVWTLIIGAVNTSIWEYIKIFSMPYIFWGCLEFCAIRVPFKKFIVAKAAGLYSIIAIFLLLFSISFMFCNLKPDTFWLTISLIACIISHLISSKIINFNTQADDLFTICMFSFILFFSMYLSFTINPPHINIFRDMKTGIHGIPSYCTDI